MPNVPSRVLELVETFDRNVEAYRSQQYKEAQLRREFIDPFFEERRLGRNKDSTKAAGTAKIPNEYIRIQH